MGLARLSLAVAAAWVATAAAAAPAARVYTLVFSGHVAGEERIVAAPDGTLRADFKYRDNGRGPDLHQVIAFAPDGGLGRYEVHGTSTFGAPVDERFERDAGGARWKSLADTREVRVAASGADASRVYVPIEGSGELLASTARQLLRAPGRSLKGWAGGSFAARVLATTTVAGPAGARAKVDLVAVSGLDFNPSYLWLRHDAGRAYFAEVSDDFFEIVQGWDAAAPGLFALQNAQDRRERARLAAQLAHRPGDEFVIRDVRVFDAEHARLPEARSDVYVSRGRVALVAPAGSVVRGDDIAVVEGGGRTLLPGLFDMHVHDGPNEGLLHLAGGVTTGRDMGSINAALRALSNDIDHGDSLGERVVACGFLEGESPYSARLGYVVDSQEAALEKVDWYAQHGYRQVKLYSSIHPDWVPAIARRAHELGLRVSGHIPAFMSAEQAVLAGYDEIQHINQVTLNFLAGPQDDTRTLLRFDLVARKAKDLDLESPEVARFLALLKERGTAVDTTAATFERSFTQLQGEPDPSLASVASHLPPSVQRSLRVNSTDVTPENVAASRASYDTMLRLVKKLYDAGIPLEAGTDDLPGFMLHRELELYVKTGIPPAQALRIATWNGARFTRTLDRLGSIEPGKLADFALVDGDPTTRIEDIEQVAMTVKEGTIYFPAELYRAIGVEPFAAPPVLRVPQRKPPATGLSGGSLAGALRRAGHGD